MPTSQDIRDLFYWSCHVARFLPCISSYTLNYNFVCEPRSSVSTGNQEKEVRSAAVGVIPLLRTMSSLRVEAPSPSYAVRAVAKRLRRV